MSYASGRPHPNTILTPTSLDSSAHNAVSYGSPTALAVKSEWGDSGQSTAVTPEDSTAPSKKKQKRNKPTLSCHECVERKTKVRSTLLACLQISRSTHTNQCVGLTPNGPDLHTHYRKW